MTEGMSECELPEQPHVAVALPSGRTHARRAQRIVWATHGATGQYSTVVSGSSRSLIGWCVYGVGWVSCDDCIIIAQVVQLLKPS